MFRERILLGLFLVVGVAALVPADDISWDDGHSSYWWHQPENWAGPTCCRRALVTDVFPWVPLAEW